jgi:hypothetical protein
MYQLRNPTDDDVNCEVPNSISQNKLYNVKEFSDLINNRCNKLKLKTLCKIYFFSTNTKDFVVSSFIRKNASS